MSSVTTISIEKLARLVGTPKGPAIVDVRVEDDFAADPRLIPGAVRRPCRAPGEWVAQLAGRSAILVCQRGQTLSEGAAAWLRHEGVQAEVLAGGLEAWAKAGLPLVPAAKLPARDERGRTVWVTRARPKIDRIACPWLIRRFVDPAAVFLFVAPAEVAAVAERFAATPFDVEDVFWSHRGETCTFDTMVEELALTTEPLLRLARIVRGADTARLDIEPEAPGLLAASLGLSRMYADDLEQLEAGLLLYDAFYRWCRDATDETHNWPSSKPARV
jgi:rhodanese-related sulfurtransferase